MKKLFTIIINFMFLAMTLNNTNASPKVKTEDLDLPYFRETVWGQLRDAYIWAGVLEGEMDKDGYKPEKRPKKELREAFTALGRGEVESYSRYVRSYYQRKRERDKYEDHYGMTALFLNTLDYFCGGFGNYANVVIHRIARNIGTDIRAKYAVLKRDGSRIEYTKELESYDKTKSTLINITFQTAKDFVEMLGDEPEEELVKKADSVDGLSKTLSGLKLIKAGE
jgi:hypothetical protein